MESTPNMSNSTAENEHNDLNHKSDFGLDYDMDYNPDTLADYNSDSRTADAPMDRELSLSSAFIESSDTNYTYDNNDSIDIKDEPLHLKTELETHELYQDIPDSITLTVVQNINDIKAKDGLNFDRRLEFKSNGRPRPLLRIIQTNRANNREVHRYFKESMYELSDWICGCEVSNAFYCFVCLLFSNESLWCKIGVIDLKHLKDKVRKHSVSADHMRSSVDYSTLGSVNIRLQLDSAYRNSIHVYNENVVKNRYILNKIIDCVKFCGAFELALRGHDETESSENVGIFRGLINFVSELDSIFKTHLDQSTVFKGISKTLQNDLLDSMLAVTQERIKSEVELSDFVAIQVDETTDSSNETQTVFVIRYVLNGTVHERFLKFINPPGATARELTNMILTELESLEINKKPDKLIAQSYDRAATMSGRLGGVEAKIKQQYPAANFIHCYAHQLSLILQKAASQNKAIRIFFVNLHSFSSFFDTSPKRTAVLDEVVKIRLPKAAPTKWYFNTRCVEAVYIHQTDILTCLARIIDEEVDANTINQAIGLQNFLQNENFLYWLKFFHLIMPNCEILFNQLQKRNIDVISVKNDIVNFKTSIQKVRSQILNNDSYETPTSSSLKRKRNQDSYRQVSLEICDIVLSEIVHRFSFSDHLIIAQLFYSERFEVYDKNFPDDIFNLVKEHFPVLNHSKLKTELEVIYDREDFRENTGAVAILQLFINNNLCEIFSESVKLLKMLCTLPMTTVESERCFSTLKRIKTFLRNTMGKDRMCALAMLSIERGFIKNIVTFNELVIDHFANSKDRRIDLKYKSL